MSIIPLFCKIDDFCLQFEPKFNQMLLEEPPRQRLRKNQLNLSEVMTILLNQGFNG